MFLHKTITLVTAWAGIKLENYLRQKQYISFLTLHNYKITRSCCVVIFWKHIKSKLFSAIEKENKTKSPYGTTSQKNSKIERSLMKYEHMSNDRLWPSVFNPISETWHHKYIDHATPMPIAYSNNTKEVKFPSQTASAFLQHSMLIHTACTHLYLSKICKFFCQPVF